jgi:hypothetical protein
MISSEDKKRIEAKIAQLYHSDPSGAVVAIENYLQDCLVSESAEEKIALVDQFARNFHADVVPPQGGGAPINTHALMQLVPLLLGKNSDEIDCSTDELIERLAESLNTVFDTLNELILGINTTLMGQTSGTETIRLVIRSNVEDSSDSISLHNYLAQIKEAFSIMHEAFKDAAMIKMSEMLAELDPQELEKSMNGGLKIGPFQKAEMFKLYEQKYRTLENWLKTGLIKEALLREFEKNCQKIYARK